MYPPAARPAMATSLPSMALSSAQFVSGGPLARGLADGHFTCRQGDLENEGGTALAIMMKSTLKSSCPPFFQFAMLLTAGCLTPSVAFRRGPPDRPPHDGRNRRRRRPQDVGWT